MTKKKLLILGSKEYPLGLNKGFKLDFSQERVKLYDLPSGGMEVFTESVVKHLKKDFDITIISAWFPDSKRYEEINGIKVHRVKRIPGRIIRGITFPLFSFFKALLLKEHFDVIIANGPVASFFAMVLSKLKRTKYICMPHGFASEQKEIPSILRKIMTYFSTLAYSKANAMFYVSQKEIEYYCGEFFNRYPVLVGQGIDFDEWQRVETVVDPHFKHITFVGRLTPVKGVDVLLDSLHLVKGDWACNVIGDGPQKDELMARATDASFWGQRSRDSLKYDISDSDVFVIPSYSEGFPITILEAMALKVPVVVSDIGLPFEDNIHVFIFPPGDAIALAKQINRILNDSHLRKNLVANAYEHVREYYDIKDVAKRMTEAVVNTL